MCTQSCSYACDNDCEYACDRGCAYACYDDDGATGCDSFCTTGCLKAFARDCSTVCASGSKASEGARPVAKAILPGWFIVYSVNSVVRVCVQNIYHEAFARVFFDRSSYARNTTMPGKVFLPVIHVHNLIQTLENIALAKFNGADGVFLINHGSVSADELVGFYHGAVEEHPEFWIGMNCLDLTGEQVFHKVPDSLGGVWVDDGGVSEESSGYARKIKESRENSTFPGLYFGGVAFKGQAHVDDVQKVAATAIDFMDVVTTSGPQTGFAAPVEKIAAMKESIGDRPLALASGVTIDNVGDYLPYVDYFLVATGISKSFHELDPVKVRCLAEAIHDV